MSELPKIVRERLAQVPAGPHPDPDLLNAFAEHALAPRERALVLAHVSACQECRQLISLAALPLGDTEAAPPPQPARPWFAWGYMRWSGAVAAVLLVASIALMFQSQWRDPELKPVSEQPRAQVVAEPAADRDAPLYQKVLPEQGASQAKPASPPREESRRDTAADRAAKPAPPPPPPAAVAVGGTLNEGGRAAGAAAPTRDAPAAQPALAAESKKEKDEKLDSLAMSHVTKTPEATQASNRQRAQNSEVAEAEAESPVVDSTTAQAAAPGEKRSADTGKLARQAPAPLRTNTFSLADAGAAWRITAAGALERTFDGRTWKTALTFPDVRFTAVAALGNHVWAGASGGVVYITSDNGRRWLRRQLAINGNALKEDVLAISIDAAASGTVHTSSGSYTTTDGGATWSKAAGQ
jgi:hypothetical protein